MLSRLFSEQRVTQSLKACLMLTLICLTACHSKLPPGIIQNESKLPHKVALGDPEIIKLEQRLTGQGVQITSIGQDSLLSIPAKSLFNDQSPRLTRESYKQLNEIACYLRQFRTVGLNVAAFTSRYVSSKREHALSVARAHTVANYLWSQGVDSRLLFTQGMGSDKPIVTSSRPSDKSPNARVEITFRRTIV
ncbi:MAG: OmpA family protein [Legionellaceae bacterium]|nr:OmpA family protein [Legionellaceae bacterium]